MISEDRLRQAVRDAGALLDQSLPVNGVKQPQKSVTRTCS